MGTKQIRYCDLCHEESGTDTLRYGYGKASREIDLCPECYESQMGWIDQHAKRAAKGSVRPQHKFAVTPVSKRNL